MRKRYVVSGRVQGVGFRQFAAEKARALKVAGWVKNLPDGNVEVEAEAAADTLGAFEKYLSEGPAFGRVATLAADELPEGGDLPPIFEIRR